MFARMITCARSYAHACSDAHAFTRVHAFMRMEIECLASKCLSKSQLERMAMTPVNH